MRRPRRPAQDLRFTVECLPRRTREAMLQGIEANTIIVGAYTDRDGGVCPMLAAHRRGGRTSLASFARAWDRYTRAGKRSRQATDREVRTLKSMLEASLARDDYVRDEFAAAVAELRAIQAQRVAEADRAATGPAEDVRPTGAIHPAGAPEKAARPQAGPAPAADERRRVRETGERDRSQELQRRPGWAWLRVFRRYDEYEAALERVHRAERELERRELERV